MWPGFKHATMGLLGARAMHSLENYRRHEPEHDGNMKSYSSTYHPATGTLQLFRPPHDGATRPSRTSRVSYDSDSVVRYDTIMSERFREGATAFRNLRELAESTRDSAVRTSQPCCSACTCLQPLRYLYERVETPRFCDLRTRIRHFHGRASCSGINE